jgi:pimeloyl-ACP methyl ester carboxylesterase
MKLSKQGICETPALRASRQANQPSPRRERHTDFAVSTGDGVELAVRVFGPQSAHHTVVLLHGLCVSDAVWSGQIEYLLQHCGRGVRVVSYDHRGHGRSSDAHVDTYHIEQLASDLAEVLYALDIGGPLTIVGHSMGGMTALAYLARPGNQRPVDPQGLVLIATAAGRLAQHGLGRLLAAPGAGALLGLVNHLPRSALASLARPLCSALSGLWPAQRIMLSAVADAVADTSLPTAAGFLPGLRRYDQHRVLQDIRAQTVIVSGTADPLTPASHSRELARTISDAVHIKVPNAGHMLPREVPDIVNDAIRRAMSPKVLRQPSSGYHRITAGGRR